MPSSYTVELPDVNYFTRQVLCREGCPVRTDAGGYVQAIAEGRYEEGLQHLMAMPMEELKKTYTKREMEPELSQDDWTPKNPEQL